MTTNISFCKTEISKISSCLNEQFENHDGKSSITRASAAHMLVAGVQYSHLDEALALIESFAPVHPARFFIPVIDNQILTPSAEIGLIKVPVSGGSIVCSEVIKILVPENSWAAIPSIVASHTLPGLSHQVFIFGWDNSIAQALLSADLIYFDGEVLSFKSLSTTLKLANKGEAALVDFSWVRLGAWREAITRLFNVREVQASLSQLGAVEFCIQGWEVSCFHLQPFLLCGWIVNRLSLEVTGYGADGWECRSDISGKTVTFSMGRQNKPSDQSIKKNLMSLKFISRDGEEIGHIKRVGDFLEGHATLLGVDSSPVFKRLIEKDELIGVLHRYFLVGDSNANYESSVALGLDMFELTTGFSG